LELLEVLMNVDTIKRGRLVEAAAASAEVRNIVLNVMFFFKKTQL
jgi:hypothetical protein